MKGIEYDMMIFVIALVIALIVILIFMSGSLNIDLSRLSPV
jgi:hypothetical protein